MVNFSLETIFEGTPYKKYIPDFKRKGFGSIKDLNIPIHNGKLNDILESVIDDKNDIYPIQILLTKSRTKYISSNTMLFMLVMFFIFFCIWFFTPGTFSPSPFEKMIN